MKLGGPKETGNQEARVALVPEMLKTLIDAGFEIHVQAGAGWDAQYPDEDYRKAGALIEEKASEVL
jgi:alanine dehydrogenase